MKNLLFILYGLLIGAVSTAVLYRTHDLPTYDYPNHHDMVATYRPSGIFYLNYDSLTIEEENVGVINRFESTASMIDYWEDLSVRLSYIEAQLPGLDVFPMGNYWTNDPWYVVKWHSVDTAVNLLTGEHQYHNHFDTIGIMFPNHMNVLNDCVTFCAL